MPARRWRKSRFHPITYDNLSRGHREAVKWGPFAVDHDSGRRKAIILTAP
jgi:hypothetical protein